MEKREINIDGATLPFYEMDLNGVKHYQFDASEVGCPAPMVNAMVGLKYISETDKDAKLIMINSHEPNGLYAKIKDKFNWNAEKLSAGKVKIVFDSIEGKSITTDFTQTECEG